MSSVGLVAGPIQARVEQEEVLETNPWSFIPHRPNYILPFTFNSNVNQEVTKKFDNPDRFKNIEVKFQLSFKFLLGKGLFWNRGDIHFAYSQLSVWQVYNSKNSAPIRTTDFEPEVFIDFENDVPIGEFINRVVRVGISHESNGRGDQDFTRSWNRIYSELFFESGRFAWSIKPWWRIPEPSPSDDNPNIEKYYGYGELRAHYKWKKNVFGVMLRNNLRASDNKGAVEVGWSFPLFRNVKGYIQYFNGYGETLLDYRHPSQRLGIGLMLSDWL